jgi:hypothetical protein
MSTIKEQLISRYELDTQLYRLRTALETAEEDFRQAKWTLHQEEVTLVEYESGIRGILDRLKGTRADKIDARNRAVRQAESDLLLKTRERDSLKQTLAELEARSATLPDVETLRSSLTANELPFWSSLEQRFCAEQLLPLLEQTLTGLERYHGKLRGEYRNQIMDPQEAYALETDHIEPALACAGLLERLAGAMALQDQALEIPGYFRNPRGYITSAAAAHNRIDRAAAAMDQVRQVQKQLRNLL